MPASPIYRPGEGIDRPLADNEVSQPRSAMFCHPERSEGSLAEASADPQLALRMTIPVLIVKTHYRGEFLELAALGFFPYNHIM